MKKAPAKKSNKGRRSKKYLYQTGKTDIKVDKTKKAMWPGKRKSKNGGTYYEYRANRSDMPGSLTGQQNKVLAGKKSLLHTLKSLYGYYAADYVLAKTAKEKRLLKKQMMLIKKDINKIK